MLITIPDSLAADYKLHKGARHGDLDKLVTRQLQRFAKVEVGDRAVVLHGEALEEVDRLLGLGSTQSAAALLAAIRAWAGITIGGVRLDFSPAQLAEIQLRADKQGKTPEAVVQEIVEQLSRDFFYSPTVAR